MDIPRLSKSQRGHLLKLAELCADRTDVPIYFSQYCPSLNPTGDSSHFTDVDKQPRHSELSYDLNQLRKCGFVRAAFVHRLDSADNIVDYDPVIWVTDDGLDAADYIKQHPIKRLVEREPVGVAALLLTLLLGGVDQFEKFQERRDKSAKPIQVEIVQPTSALKAAP
jgi:hypothetical protein